MTSFSASTTAEAELPVERQSVWDVLVDPDLGRLLEIFRELQEDSQLIVVTHQKRTMEIADALYGVTMRGDGVTTVISQRLRDEVPA